MSTSPFGRYIRAQRVAANLSLRFVAGKLGVSHVYLGEVERGVRPPLKPSRWSKLVEIVPGITPEALERHALTSRPVQLSLADAPPQYQDLSLALARRIQKRDLSQAEMQRLMRILGKEDE